MDKEKFIGRVENMIYHICGCTFEEGGVVLRECLKRNKERKEEFKKKNLNLAEYNKLKRIE